MHVEFLGIPRERVGISDLIVDAQTLGQLLTTLRARYPSLAELIPGATLTIIPSKNSNRDAYVRAFKAALDGFLSHRHE